MGQDRRGVPRDVARSSEMANSARPDRRRFFQSLASIALNSAPLFCTCGLHGAFAATETTLAVDPAKGYRVQTIGEGVHWITDGAYSTMFLVGTDGVIACDAPPTLGTNYLKAIAEVTDKPVTHLVYSHEHVDHIAGAQLFANNVTVIAHRHTAELLASRKDPRRRLPSITFDDTYTLDIGGQRLELAYKGINHSIDNIFIFAPRQKTLMIVDVVYPGFMPYKNLGIAVDIPGFVDAHRHILAYDFTTLVAGHVDRPGSREDVAIQVQLIKDLVSAAERAYSNLSFPAFLAQHAPGGSGNIAWDLHNGYEEVLVSRMVAELMPKWQNLLAGTATYLRDNCWAMLETFVVQGRPDLSGL
jgi:glyoxylase-like metal-dependent hydrolase (beta-lactamase superfamily II)